MHSKKISIPFFSIVIPSLNEEHFLPYLISDLAAQTHTNFEVIHVDGNSDDKTVELVKKEGKNLNLRQLSTEIRNVSVQRNMGIEAAKGEWIIFMDADDRIDPWFLDGLKYRIAQNPKTDLFTTWVNIDSENTLNQPLEKTINFSLELGKMIGSEWSFGALIGVKKEILTKEFYFDDKQKVVEDGIFVKKLIGEGYTFTVFRDPKYTYSVRRFDAEGTLKMARTSARMALIYFQGKDFVDTDLGYKMEGGARYGQEVQTNILGYTRLQSFMKKATKKQLKQARDLFNYLRKFGL
ncbi:glycosyltransferase family 2 protein [Candidatus Woesebacteria bacterium]|nr:glycosyltransferase family 2 protein [Candidatus Woesebacteria bacterium]